MLRERLSAAPSVIRSPLSWSNVKLGGDDGFTGAHIRGGDSGQITTEFSARVNLLPKKCFLCIYVPFQLVFISCYVFVAFFLLFLYLVILK